LADGLKAPKEGRQMPAVKARHQSASGNTKAPFIMGHSCQAIALLVAALGQVCAVPLALPARATAGRSSTAAASLRVLNCTISLNTAAEGGRGIYNLGDAATATATINNTIIGQNSTTPSDFIGDAIDAGTSTTSGVGNLIRAQTGFAGTIASTADPLLAALADNGGPTKPELRSRRAANNSGTGILPVQLRGQSQGRYFPQGEPQKTGWKPVPLLGGISTSEFGLKPCSPERPARSATPETPPQQQP
jgi:hypothetical protein